MGTPWEYDLYLIQKIFDGIITPERLCDQPEFPAYQQTEAEGGGMGYICYGDYSTYFGYDKEPNWWLMSGWCNPESSLKQNESVNSDVQAFEVIRTHLMT